MFRSEKERKRTNSTSSSEASDPTLDYYSTDKTRQPETFESPLGLDDINIKDDFADVSLFSLTKLSPF
jgi:hypothetical protein